MVLILKLTRDCADVNLLDEIYSPIIGGKETMFLIKKKTNKL